MRPICSRAGTSGPIALAFLLVGFQGLAQTPPLLDLSWVPETNSNSIAIAVQPDGRVLLDCLDPVVGVLRLMPDGSLDPSFQGGGFNSNVLALALQPDGKLLVGGMFTQRNGTPCGNIVRMNPDGSLDDTFHAPVLGMYPRFILLRPDGRILLNTADTHSAVYQLDPDGSLDTSFGTGPGANDQVMNIALQPDGKLLVCGLFSSYDGRPSSSIVRLDINGRLDTTFVAPPIVGISCVSLLPDGRMYAGGGGVFAGGYRGLVRLGPDGALDTGFNVGNGFNSIVRTVHAMPDGSVLVCGQFSMFQGFASKGIQRITPEGTYDATFDSGMGPASVSNIAFQPPNGQLLVCGSFSDFGGVPRKGAARLHECITPLTWYVDADGDGFGDSGRPTIVACEGPDGYAAVAGDCNDADAGNYPGAPCQDDDPATIQEVWTDACTCVGRYTQLTDIPAPVQSCKAVNLQVGSDVLAAFEVPGADLYQFNFTNAPTWPAYNRNISFPTPSFVLTPWATLPLKAGRSYRVKVRVSFDNGDTWSPFGADCGIHIGYPPGERDERSLAMGTDDPGLLIRPNPNRGDRFDLQLGAFAEEEGTLTVRVSDAFGRLVMDRAYAPAPLLAVDLPGGLASGLYLVEVMAGDRRQVQRLVVE